MVPSRTRIGRHAIRQSTVTMAAKVSYGVRSDDTAVDTVIIVGLKDNVVSALAADGETCMCPQRAGLARPSPPLHSCCRCFGGERCAASHGVGRYARH